MIVDYNARRLILTPPHTASRHLHQALATQAGCHWLIGPGPEPPEYDHHTTHIAPEFTGWERIAVVRHPLDRLRGLYRHYAGYAREHARPVQPWPDWLTAVADDDHRVPWYFRYTLDRWLGSLDVDHHWRYEALAALLAAYYPGAVLPDPYPPSDEPPAWNPGTLYVATRWATPDFYRFDYFGQTA